GCHRQDRISGRPTMGPRTQFPNRRDVFTAGLACSCSALLYAQEARAEETPRDVFLERAAEGKPHKGKVLLAVQAHSDDIPLMAGGGGAKLVKEGYTGYLSRATNDYIGETPGLGTAGPIRHPILRKKRDNAAAAPLLHPPNT